MSFRLVVAFLESDKDNNSNKMDKIISSVIPKKGSASISSSREGTAGMLLDENLDGDDASFSLSSMSYGRMEDLSLAMQESIEIKDRKWYGKTYRNCFLHADAIAWMMEKVPCDEFVAVDKLNDLRLAGYVQHVVDPHKPFKVKQKNKTLFFCFLDDHQSHANLFPNKTSKLATLVVPFVNQSRFSFTFHLQTQFL